MPTTSEKARKAALARWESVALEDRTEPARLAALARWTDGLDHTVTAANLERRRQARDMPCPNCGVPVGRAGRKHCGADDCRLAHNARRMGVHVQAYRARKAGATVERVVPLDVYERDGWACGICGDPVDQSLKHPDPMSPSLDHTIPLSLGGEHSYANTRCSHLSCNCKRSNRS